MLCACARAGHMTYTNAHIAIHSPYSIAGVRSSTIQWGHPNQYPFPYDLSIKKSSFLQNLTHFPHSFGSFLVHFFHPFLQLGLVAASKAAAWKLMQSSGEGSVLNQKTPWNFSGNSWRCQFGSGNSSKNLRYRD